MDGLLVVDKPAGLTSHDIVDRLRRRWRVPRMGHGGTLDPMATGVLLLLLGRATKSAETLLGLDKSYEAVVTLGVTTDTQDTEGRVLERLPVPPLTKEAMDAACAPFRGEIEQLVPAYSAVRFGGRRGYELARAGEPVPEKRRRVQVALDVLDVTGDRVLLAVTCSKGTYVRTLAHDLGQALGCGGMLSALRRTRVGPWSLTDAHTLAALEALAPPAVEPLLRPVSA
ncbi:MAG: tRNA pseudouridine(55) synthase TruB [Omnitrophica WOR_2 bacterium RIFCSPHIGHO2_02_FULL_68_15]|nr:MAG: tRNA pseudouridine(55) synthase TruB [Omnitrophica WOR_2 bacterium RIFCSPHIGHO2_02_FULL_68_15]